MNPLEESKHNKEINRIVHTNFDLSEEIADGDEGIVNRKLPINSYNHQSSI